MQEENGESLLPSLTTYIQNIRLSYVIVNVGRNKHYNLVGNVGREQTRRDGGTVPVARQMAPCLAPRRHGAILCRSWPWHAGHHVTGLYLFRTSDMN